eukprot:365157-Chlamydomonas_euryale.AAC.37
MVLSICSSAPPAVRLMMSELLPSARLNTVRTAVIRQSPCATKCSAVVNVSSACTTCSCTASAGASPHFATSRMTCATTSLPSSMSGSNRLLSPYNHALDTSLCRHPSASSMALAFEPLHASASGCSTSTAKLPSKASPASCCSSVPKNAPHAVRSASESLVRPHASF